MLPAPSSQQYGVGGCKIKLTSPFINGRAQVHVSIDTASSLITVTHTIVYNQLQAFDLRSAGIYSVMPPPTDQLIKPVHVFFIPRTTCYDRFTSQLERESRK